MAFTGDDITQFLSSRDRVDELAEVARENVSQRRIAAQTEEARSQPIGSGVDGSDSDLEAAKKEKAAPEDPVTRNETDMIQKAMNWMTNTSEKFMSTYAGIVGRLTNAETKVSDLTKQIKTCESELKQVKEKTKKMEEDLSKLKEQKSKLPTNNGYRCPRMLAIDGRWLTAGTNSDPLVILSVLNTVWYTHV